MTTVPKPLAVHSIKLRLLPASGVLSVAYHLLGGEKVFSNKTEQTQSFGPGRVVATSNSTGRVEEKHCVSSHEYYEFLQV